MAGEALPLSTTVLWSTPQSMTPLLALAHDGALISQ